MPMINHTHEWQDGVDDVSAEFAITYSVTPYRGAVVNADPDRCHPAEGGIEVELIECVSFERHYYTDDEPWFAVKAGGKMSDSLSVAAVEYFKSEYSEDRTIEFCQDSENAKGQKYAGHNRWHAWEEE